MHMHVKAGNRDLEHRTPQGSKSCGGSHFSQLIGLQQLPYFHATWSPHHGMTAATMSGGTMHVAMPVQHSGAAKDRGAKAV